MTKSPNQSPIFEGLSLEEPSILSVSFKSDPSASLGVKLSNHDNGLTNEMFLPGYASVGGMLPGKTLAKTCGVQSGDYIVAVNGVGYRRFPPDFNDDELKDVTEGLDLINLDSPTKKSEKGEKDDNENGEDDNDDEEGEEDAIIKQERELKVSIILHYYCMHILLVIEVALPIVIYNILHCILYNICNYHQQQQQQQQQHATNEN